MGGEIARMNMKKWTALFAALALALCVLAGCGGSRALTSVLLDLLEGQYKNVSVETDPELERALRRAAADGGDTADILARLKNEPNLTGGSLSLSRLGDGQQGERAVELRFEPGSDPDAAARRVFVTWNGVFGGLPRDGQYAAAIAMIEAENGYYIAVDVNVVKAGAQHDDSDDEPEEEPDDGFVKVGTLNELEKALNSEDETPPKIRLTKDITISDSNWSGFPTFSGELDGNNQTVTIEGGSQGLFQEIAADGKVENLNINVAGSISASGNNDAGGVAGGNSDNISGCTVTIESGGSITASASGSAYAGSVVGRNLNGTVDDYTVEDSNDPKLPEIGN